MIQCVLKGRWRKNEHNPLASLVGVSQQLSEILRDFHKILNDKLMHLLIWRMNLRRMIIMQEYDKSNINVGVFKNIASFCSQPRSLHKAQ